MVKVVPGSHMRSTNFIFLKRLIIPALERKLEIRKKRKNNLPEDRYKSSFEKRRTQEKIGELCPSIQSGNKGWFNSYLEDVKDHWL